MAIPSTIPQFGYSSEMFALANILITSAKARASVRDYLTECEDWITYSYQDFDRKQYLADLLTDLVRAPQ